MRQEDLPMGAATEYVVDPDNPHIAVGRRARDHMRLFEAAGRDESELAERELEQLVCLAGDDLRETARAAAAVERWLGEALGALDREAVTRVELGQLAGDATVIDRLDALSDTLAGLRCRLAAIARRLR
jgi:hypothetical protein